MKRVLAIILGGGAGTRLYPLTKMRAKPAVPLAGKYRLIDIPISNCINSSINKMYVLTQFNSASLNRHLGQSYNLSAAFGQGFVEVLAAQQTPESPSWFEGTADAVRKYQWLFQEWDVDEYLILSGDQLYRMDYSLFVEHHRRSGADLTVAALPVDAEQAEGFGLMRTDSDGNIQEFREKPKGESLKAMAVDTSRFGLSAESARNKPYLASMGIYVFSRATLFDLLHKNPSHKDFGKEVIPEALARGDRLQSYVFDEYWEDIGTIGAFYEANLALTQQPNPPFSFYDEKFPIYTRPRYLPPTKLVDAQITESIIGEGSILKSCSIHHCVLGVRSRVESDVVLQDSLVMGSDFYESSEERTLLRQGGGIPLGVGQGTTVKGAILDKNTRIGNNVTIVNKDHVEEADRADEGFYIRNGIVVVVKNATISDGTVI
ncbi:ADP-glucose pyrophosphorylase [Prochlorococcus marinus str. MIT 9313]|uniref:Glucose-1-phosphate adenylyltransferase n=1 Tax=Prochlorococcus marinus (strain MIT 9313) TaxID=74547 RepID=Q7V810_PROMM|nr:MULTISPECIES: glucose-1-phosphate adenylyltransferase [Prochlorococcus]MCH2565362.1 glucose-1-phosphate adenylyltransferase [Prochlorococcus sp. ALOHA_A2.0_51]MEC7381492.1 glucose-1-phosphate adenylyltransferase [Cyanobacteriota bacterium]KZR60681.1 Glucose-1-phosphate adenylyltransferase [Prochlorococcus marinus str. MIT 1312]KZR66124.1 Glucose-1-phosphate adenylyltransferase [Prochlorococcus sp. MIT 1303]KZR69117.1 Glucose-1-phosphate adenylyltransferase [Prochlorococcus marinus str. MIT 